VTGDEQEGGGDKPLLHRRTAKGFRPYAERDQTSRLPRLVGGGWVLLPYFTPGREGSGGLIVGQGVPRKGKGTGAHATGREVGGGGGTVGGGKWYCKELVGRVQAGETGVGA